MATPIVNLREIVETEVSSNTDIVAVNQAQVDIQNAVTYIDNKVDTVAGTVISGKDELDSYTNDKITELETEANSNVNVVQLAGAAEVASVNAIADDRLAEYNDNAIGDGTDDPDTGGKLGYFNHNYAVKKSAMDTVYDNYLIIESNVHADADQIALDRTQVETLFDEFDDRWLGAKEDDPTVNNDGDPITDGILYWNTTNNVLMVYADALGGWTQGTVTASTLQAIDKIDDVITQIEDVGNEIANKVYEGDTKSSIEVVASDSAVITVVAGDSSVINTVAGDTTAINEIYDNRDEIYAADDNAAIATAKADEANSSAVNALASEDKAAKWAEEATDTEVETGKYSAKHWAGKSENSGISALDAKTASESAQSAAEAAKDAAGVSETNAKTSENNAGSSEVNANNSEVMAQEWSSKDVDVEITGNANMYSAKHYSIKANDSAVLSETSNVASQLAQSESENARDLASKWASEVEDVEVTPGEYSAKHWATKANVDKMVWKGEWAAGTYEINDVVRYGTNNYIVVVDSTTEEPSTGVEWEISMEGASPYYTFAQDGTELVISSAGYVQFPVIEGEW